MKISPPRLVAAVCAAALAAGLTASARQATPRPLGALVVAAGFTFEVFAENVSNARMMALGPQGTVFVGSQYAGNVYAVVDRDGDHKAERVVTIASGLRQPNGVAMRNGALYVATTSQILRFDDIEKQLDSPPQPGCVVEQARADRPLVVYDAQGLLDVLPKLGVHRHLASVPVCCCGSEPIPHPVRPGGPRDARLGRGRRAASLLAGPGDSIQHIGTAGKPSFAEV